MTAHPGREHDYKVLRAVGGTSWWECACGRREGEANEQVALLHRAKKAKRHGHVWTPLVWGGVGPGPMDPPPQACHICGLRFADYEARQRRGRNNRKRGQRIQRERIEGLGDRNLAGNNPNLDGIGELFAYEHKSGGAFPQRFWRWLKDIPHTSAQVPVLIVTDAPGPGHKARSVVVVDWDDWLDLHGPKGTDHD